MRRRIILAAVTLLAAAAIAVAVFILLHAGKKDKVTIEAARINEVKSMVSLCAMEIYREVPVLDTVNDKVIVAVQKQQGSISFDIENLHFDDEGDTVRLVLPHEMVEIRESAEDNAWQVIDTKNIGFLGVIRRDRLTDREENRVKAKLRRNAISSLYKDGTVARARTEAAKNLELMLEKIYRKPVKVVESVPAQ